MIYRIIVFSFLVGACIASTARASTEDTTEHRSSVPDGYRHFIMPSARPIEGGYFGFWELGFLQGGAGIGAVSASAGFTVLPTVAFRSQIGFLQAKLTLYDERELALAAGINWLRLTSDYPYTHIFAVLTVETESHARYSGSVFYKASGDDFPHPDIAPYGSFQFSYGGSLGASLGMDMPLEGWPNTRFVAELWNHDLSVPNKLAVLAALRLESADFSSDFGLMYFTLPLIAPVANFVWRF